MRKMLSERKQNLNKLHLKDITGIVKEESTVTARDGHKIAIRVYKPEDAKGGLPLVVYFHGGGFILGGLENEEVLCHRFSKEHGTVVINVDYRLAPENPFPNAPNDAWDVVKWVRA